MAVSYSDYWLKQARVIGHVHVNVVTVGLANYLTFTYMGGEAGSQPMWMLEVLILQSSDEISWIVRDGERGIIMSLCIGPCVTV